MKVKLLKLDDIKINYAFFAYFCLMFTLYTNTYIQLFSQIGLVLYVLFKKMKGLKIQYNIKHILTVFRYLLWFGGFFLLIFASQNWAYSTLSNSKTIITAFRILIMGLCIILYVDSKEKFYSIFKSFIYSTIILCVTALLTTPISKYGMSGDYGFGYLIGQHRNQIGFISSVVGFCCYCLYHNKMFKNGNFLFIFFVIVTVITGSRTSIIQLLLMLFLYMIQEKRISNLLLKFIKVSFFSLIIILLFYIIPFTRNTIIYRITDSINVIFQNDTTADSSTYSRVLIRKLAFDMFKTRPIYGYGVDGFITYFDNNRVIENKHFGTVVYSHSNVAEIAADFGIVGLVMWYWLIIYMLFKSFRYKNNNLYIKISFIYIFTSLFMDLYRVYWSNHLSMYIIIMIYLMLQVHLCDEDKIEPNIIDLQKRDY